MLDYRICHQDARIEGFIFFDRNRFEQCGTENNVISVV